MSRGFHALVYALVLCATSTFISFSEMERTEPPPVSHEQKLQRRVDVKEKHSHATAGPGIVFIPPQIGVNPPQRTYRPPSSAWSSCKPEEPVPSNPFAKSVRGVHYDVDYDISRLVPPRNDAVTDGLCHPDTNTSLGVTVLSRSPCVVHIANFFTDEECDGIIIATRGGIKPESLDQHIQVPFPTTMQSDPRARFHTLRGNFQDVHFSKHDLAIKYYAPSNSKVGCLDPGNPYLDPRTKHSRIHIHNRSRRALHEGRFVILYLTTVSSGGETWFPYANCRNPNREPICCGEFGLRVRPVKGSLLVVYDATREDTLDHLAAHDWCPNNREEKIIWVTHFSV